MAGEGGADGARDDEGGAGGVDDDDDDDEEEVGELNHPGTVWAFRAHRRRWRRRLRSARTTSSVALAARRLRISLADARILSLGLSLEPRRWRRRKVKGSA